MALTSSSTPTSASSWVWRALANGMESAFGGLCKKKVKVKDASQQVESDPSDGVIDVKPVEVDNLENQECSIVESIDDA